MNNCDLNSLHINMDFSRLGLERGGTANEALKVITSLLAAHGQGGPCFEEASKQKVTYHNSFLIADPSEAWVLETAGQHWAAQKVEGKGPCLVIQSRRPHTLVLHTGLHIQVIQVNLLSVHVLKG